MLDILLGFLTSNNLLIGVVIGDFIFSSLAGGETVDSCPSNAFRYNESRYCSKCTTSSSKTAISLINSVAGCSHIKGLLDWKETVELVNVEIPKSLIDKKKIKYNKSKIHDLM